MAIPILSSQCSVVIDGSSLLAFDNFTFSIDKQFIEIKHLDSTVKERYPDGYEWQISFDGGVVKTSSIDAGKFAYENMIAKIKSDASVAVYILPNVSSNKYESGWGYFSNVTQNGGVGGEVTYSGEITSSSLLTSKITA